MTERLCKILDKINQSIKTLLFLRPQNLPQMDSCRHLPFPSCAPHPATCSWLYMDAEHFLRSESCVGNLDIQMSDAARSQKIQSWNARITVIWGCEKGEASPPSLLFPPLPSHSRPLVSLLPFWSGARFAREKSSSFRSFPFFPNCLLSPSFVPSFPSSSPVPSTPLHLPPLSYPVSPLIISFHRATDPLRLWI